MRHDSSTGFGFTRARYETEPFVSFAPTESVTGNLLALLDSLIGGVNGASGLGLLSGVPSLSRLAPVLDQGERVLTDLLGLQLARAELELMDLHCPAPNPWLVR